MPRRKVRISLANKCQLLFGSAVVLILAAALTVGWLRMRTLVNEGQEETARKLASTWLTIMVQSSGNLTYLDSSAFDEAFDQTARITLYDENEFEEVAARSPFLETAISRFTTRPDSVDVAEPTEDNDGRRTFRYARAIRKSDIRKMTVLDGAAAEATLDTTEFANPLKMVMLVELSAELAERQLLLNRIYIVVAGLFAGLLAIGVFWYITTRVILSPVRLLRDTTEKIADGDLNIRSDINTGDEFEQLSDTFNDMLESLRKNQEELRQANRSLDLKLGELAQTNVSLYEANRIKGEFLANVSHELRTPLNSIVGFAEVLEETLRDRTGPVDEKRKRYVNNIITSSKRLLDLINDLLDLAKIEAGRVDVRISHVSIHDTCEGLINLIRPQAGEKNIDLRMQVDRMIPLVQTDAGKLQQIVFNFLSNAVKFTPEGGSVTLKADLLNPEHGPMRLRLSVIDTGEGIDPDEHERIFEKFTQLDPTVTREYGGTGLGLTISRDLARLLQGEIELESEPGKGATFSLILPITLEAQSVPLMPDLVDGKPAVTSAVSGS